MGSRFTWKEISANRIITGFGRRIYDLPHNFSWRLGSKQAIANRGKLNQYKNRHHGERCFILANGPSLNRVDLTLLNNEITFGMNRIYLLFAKSDFRPSYYVSINELVLEQFHHEINSLSFPKFINWNQRKFFNDDENTIFVRAGLNISEKFTKDPLFPLSSGGTVTYIAMQLAFYMGFTQVILIGLDHNFSDKGIPNKTEIQSKNEDTNHFAPDYFPKGIKWQLPDLARSEMAYQLARKEFERDGRQIFDATNGGKCEVFEKIEFESLFQK